jgi:mannose-6-phosphate isomerase-like protein (cupin superfamily)
MTSQIRIETNSATPVQSSDLFDADVAVGVEADSICERCERPWGFYETLMIGKRFQVKRIVVRPGGKLSLQSHLHRSETWVVVAGRA